MTLQSFAAVLPLIAFVLLAAYAVRENRKLNEDPGKGTEQNPTENGARAGED
jgi:hypothetical protein